MDDAAADDDIRVGSPFAVDPETVLDPNQAPSTVSSQPISADEGPETFYNVGPLRYTALGAVAAAIMILLFAIPATWWFPAGGSLIAALGCLLSIFGMYSPIPKRAAAVLVLHVALFVVCYGRMISEG